MKNPNNNSIFVIESTRISLIEAKKILEDKIDEILKTCHTYTDMTWQLQENIESFDSLISRSSKAFGRPIDTFLLDRFFMEQLELCNYSKYLLGILLTDAEIAEIKGDYQNTDRLIHGKKAKLNFKYKLRTTKGGKK